MNQTDRRLKAASNKTLRVFQLGSPTGAYGAERWILSLIKHLDPQKKSISSTPTMETQTLSTI
jgi:hypothetical protein